MIPWILCSYKKNSFRKARTKAAEEEATETFHKMDAEINKLLRRIVLLEDLLQRNGIPVPERLLYKQIASLAVILSEETIAKYPARQSSFSISEAFSSDDFSVTPSFS